MKLVEKEISLEELKVVFDSMINLRPSQGNRSRSVENPQIQQKIIKIVMQLVKP